MKNFYNLLINTALSGVTNQTIWFAIIFYLYLETQSVLTTSVLSGIYLVATALSGFWLGSLVDNNKKKDVLYVSSIISLAFYAIGTVIFLFANENDFKSFSSPVVWIFAVVLLLGVLAGNLRGIAVPTAVGIIVPEEKRDRANGLVGTVGGLVFLVVSVISGILIGQFGMDWVLYLGVIFTIITIIHLLLIEIPEKEIVHIDGQSNNIFNIDIPGTIKSISAIPGLFALIFFATFNNFLGGVFMSLMDAYGLSMVDVQTWGFIWGFLSTAFIFGGLLIAKFGLGKNPLKRLFIANIIIWSITIFFTIQPSIILFVIGIYIYLLVVPGIEAAEQTIIQKVVPQERQGRVFGFAQSVEQAASPLTAFLIGPITQFIFIPFMTTGKGVDLIGPWFGTGPARGMALVFTITGVIGLMFTLFAFSSKYYKQLSNYYLENKSEIK